MMQAEKPFDYEVRVPMLTDFCMKYYIRDGDTQFDAKIFPPHVDDAIEFYILLEGDVSFMVEHSLYRLSPGDIVITKPNEMHNCILNTHSAHKHMCCWFEASEDFLFSDFLVHDFGEDNVCSPVPEDAARIAEICRELDALSSGGGDRVSEFHLGMQLLYYVRKNLGTHGERAAVPELLRHILDDIHTDLPAIHSLSYFFDKYFISPSTLTRLFRKYLHTSPKVYLETKRLAYSRVLLGRGMSVAEAAAAAGFPDYSNFIRLFRTRFGITPLQYRNS